MSFLNELKRRNVFKVGIAYLALGWVVIQVTDIAVPALNLPDVLNSIVVYLGLIGFPFALFFAWAFELTPDGVKKTEEVDYEASIATSTGRKLDFIVMGLLSIALVFVIYDSYLTPTSTINAAPSIAVLAFENISSDKDQDYFADGLSEEILNLLAKTESMKVAGRTSSFSFKGTKDDIRTIAAKLNVNHVLEGSIRKSGSTLRITAQLIRDDGYHVWSETYDRKVDDIFKIQDEISAAILKELKIRLLGETDVLTERGTENVAAYEKYLMARELIRQRRKSSIDHAVTLLKEVINMDPQYASAHAQLAISYMLLTSTQYGDLSLEDEIRLSSASIDAAVAIDANNVDALAAQGLFYNNGKDEQLSLTYLGRALKIQPNHANARRWKANIVGTMGKNKAAFNDYKILMDNDPLWVAALNNYADSLTLLGRFDEVETIISKIQHLSPDANFNTNLRAQLLTAKGQVGDAVIAYLSNNEIELAPFDLANLNLALLQLDLMHLAPVMTRYSVADIEIARGNPDKAREWAERELTNENDPFSIHQAYMIFWQLDDKSRAREAAQQVFDKYKDTLTQTNAHFFSCFWAPPMIHLLQDELGEATKVALLSSCKNYVNNVKTSDSILSSYLGTAVNLAIAEGKPNDALGYLKSANEDKILINFNLSIDLYDPLKALPEYPAAIAEMEANKEAEKQKVLAWLKDHPDALDKLIE